MKQDEIKQKKTYSAFYERLRYLIHEKGKSFNQIERELGYSRNALSNYKQNRIPSAIRLVQLSEYFGVSPEYLLGKKAHSETEKIEKISNELEEAYTSILNLKIQIEKIKEELH